MNVEQLMTSTVRTCCPNDPLSDAARVMWEADCGCVPVTEECYGSAKVVGVITDRDICMAAFTQGFPCPRSRSGA
jgi:CBS domain-containing protein